MTIPFVDMPKKCTPTSKLTSKMKLFLGKCIRRCSEISRPFLCLFFQFCVFMAITSAAPIPPTSVNSTHAEITISGVSYPIIEQPTGDPFWISEDDDAFTSFGLANYDGYTWLLAHDNKAGQHIATLEVGDVVTVDRVRYTIVSVEYHGFVPWQALATQPGLYLQTCQGDGIMIVRGVENE